MISGALVFDSSPLNYFCRAGCLDVLEQLTRGSPRFVTRAVRAEIEKGVARYPELQQVLDAQWLGLVGEDPAVLQKFAEFSRQIGRSGKNVGEASVLAWAAVHQATAVIDDQAGYKLAKRHGIAVIRSLTLLAHAVRDGSLSEVGAETLVDLLRDSEAYFPTSGSDFIAWAHDQGFL